MTKLFKENRIEVIATILTIVMIGLSFLNGFVFYSKQDGILLKQRVDIHLEQFDKMDGKLDDILKEVKK